MASLLVDTPPAQEPELENGAGPAAGPGAPGEPGAGGAKSPTDPPPGVAEPVAARACSNCGQPLAPEQDWCLGCGTGAPGSSSRSGWRPAATILALTTALVLGAAAAGYAALRSHGPRRPVRTLTVAQAPAATTPVTGTSSELGALESSVPTTTVKPPKIPLTASTPTTTTPAAEEETKSESKSKQKSSTNTGGSSSENKPTPILLDTNAAQTYNPYAYPSTFFGDPSLTIDGDTSTAWTAQINPESSPLLAEGVLIDLKTAQKLSALELVSSSPGMTVQVYGANGKTVPASITEPVWVPLSHAVVVNKHHTKIKLRHPKKGYRYVTLWISRAGSASVGTPTAPGHVSVNELELFPAAS